MSFVNSPQALLSMEREWPWGLAVLADPDARDQVPEHLNSDGVAACRSAVAAGIRHGVDGEARAEVWLGVAPSGLVCIYDEMFATDSGTVALSDASNEQVLTAVVGAGKRRLRVLVDDVAFPARVVFELGAPSALRP